jgi:hypothetical protein
MKSLKKAFSSFVSLTTILWSVGGTLAFPGVASAATLASGNLIKASGPAVYYYAADGKRYVFPNEKTYFTWYSGFSSVMTITDAELAAITIGGNVTYRPGVKMVKITTDPKVYAIAKGGVLRHVPTEACATTLYGSNWNTQIEDVPDAFFVNYMVGAAINASCSDFDKNAEMNSAPTINSNMGSVPVGGSVSVSLAADTAAGVTVPQGASSVSLFKVNLAAGSDAALVTGLRVHRVGVGASSDLANVYLYDANGTRLTTGRTVNSQTNTVEFNGLNITVGANSTVSLVLTGDFNTSLTAGSQHAFEVMDAASVILSGSGTVSGSFPVRGNTFTVGSTTASRLDVLKGTTPSNPNIGATAAEISNFKFTANTNDIELRRVTLLQGGDISNSDLTDLKLYQGSTVVATAAALAGDKIVLTFNPPFVVMNGQTKSFSLQAKVGGRAGRTIKTYVEYTTDVYAVDTRYGTGAQVDIATNGTFDGSTSGSKFITVTTQGGQLTVAFNGPATANIPKASQDAVLYKFSLTSSDNNLEIRRLRFRIDSLDGGQLEAGTTDYITDIKVKDLDTGATVMGPTALPATATSGTSFSLSDVFQLNAGQTRNLAITADIANVTVTTFVNHQFRACLSDDTATAVAAGTAVSTTCTAGDSIFQSGDVKVVTTGENLDTAKIVPNAAISGNTMTVRSASLSVALAASPSADTAVKKQSMIPAAGFVFTAGTESDSLVRSVKLTGVGAFASGIYSATTTASIITSCGLFDGAAQVGTSQSPDTTAGTMNFTNLNVSIPKGTSKTLVAKCTADSVVEGTSDFFAVGIASGATDVVAEDQDNNQIDLTSSLSSGVTGNAGSTPTVAQTVMSSGVLSVVAGSQPSATLVVGGAAKKFAEFTATAQFEDVVLDRINVSSTGDAANFTGVSVRVAGADKGADVLSSGVMGNKDVNLSTPITVPKNGSVTFEVWGSVANITPSSTANGATAGIARTGATASLGIGANLQTGNWDANYASKFNVKATGQASGDLLYATGSATVGNTMVLRKTKPTITKQAVSTNTLTSGADTELYKFQITPDAAGDVRWKQIQFTVSTSSGTTTNLNNFKLFKGSTQLAANTEVVIKDTVAGTDISGATVLSSAGGSVTVYLINEEVVSGSGTVYTLRATPTLSGSGNAVSVQLVRDTTAGVTGYLGAAAGAIPLAIDQAAAADGTGETAAAFIWSDVTEPVHGFTTGTGSSRDWTNGTYVEDMTQTQTLTKS